MIFRHQTDVKSESRCREAVELLQSYLDGELDESTMRRVAEHVDVCYECGLELSVYRKVRESLIHRVPVPDDAVARLRLFAAEFEDAGAVGR